MAARSFRFDTIAPSNKIIHISPFGDDWRVVRTTTSKGKFFHVQFRGQRWVPQPSEVAAVHFCDSIASRAAEERAQEDRERIVNLRRITGNYSAKKL